MNLVKHGVVICGLVFALPSVAHASNETVFDTILNTLLSTVSASQQASDTEAKTSQADAEWTGLYGGYPDPSRAAYNDGDREGSDLSGEPLTAAPRAFPSEPGALMARDDHATGNAFDHIFDVLMDSLAADKRAADGEG